MPAAHRVKFVNAGMERHFDAKLGTISEKTSTSVAHDPFETKLKPEGRDGDALANVAALVCSPTLCIFSFIPSQLTGFGVNWALDRRRLLYVLIGTIYRQLGWLY